MEVVSIRINKVEKQYLDEIAEQYCFKKKGNSNVLSSSKALKALLEYCVNNNVNPSLKEEDKMSSIIKMIEHIHASIPHIIYHNNFQSMALATDITDEKMASIKQKNIEYMNSNFSGYQDITYQEVRCRTNNIGFNTIPLIDGNTAWKQL